MSDEVRRVLRTGLTKLREAHGLDRRGRPRPVLRGVGSARRETGLATESFHDTNPGNSPPGPLGRVLAVGGSDATVEFAAGSPDGTPDPRATVGKFLGIRAGSSLVTFALP